VFGSTFNDKTVKTTRSDRIKID